MSLLAAGFACWAAFAHADTSSARVAGFGLRTWSDQQPFTAYDLFAGRVLNSFELDMEERLTELGLVSWAREPFERKVYDFERRCLNPCPLGGWGTCVLDARVVHDECQAIAGRTLVSAAARRAPMVREVLKLVGSQTTKLPTDVDRGLQFSAAFVSGGGTFGIVAKW